MQGSQLMVNQLRWFKEIGLFVTIALSLHFSG